VASWLSTITCQNQGNSCQLLQSGWLVRKEVFGPFTVAIPFDTEEDARGIANDPPYRLAAAMHTNDVARARRSARTVQAGIAGTNDHHRVDAASLWRRIELPSSGKQRSTSISRPRL
jgi:hypothetical protein